jgi:hypothetical protein
MGVDGEVNKRLIITTIVSRTVIPKDSWKEGAQLQPPSARYSSEQPSQSPDSRAPMP